MSDNPLGTPSVFPTRYAPDVLHAIPRSAAREALGIQAPLPFAGVDIWNAWELTWLDPRGKPRVAAATLRIAADSTHIVESKSLKLYLNSLANTRYADSATVAQTIAADVSRAIGRRIDVSLQQGPQAGELTVRTLPGELLDDLDVACSATEVDPGLLTANADKPVSESLHSHLLRSLCPVTSQPDSGSLLISYAGPAINRAGLIAYIVSFRRHSDFHEACVERMFVELKARCQCETLTVYARYARRGGIDINPYRSDQTHTAENLRLWRQ